MHVAACLIRVGLTDCDSPRKRRQRAEAIVAKLHRHFNAALADVGDDRSPDELTLAAVTVGRSRRDARLVLEQLAEALSGHPDVILLQPPQYQTF